MSDELLSQLRGLQAARAIIGEAVYASSLQKLRAQHGTSTIDAALGILHAATTAAPVGDVVSGDDVVGDKVMGDKHDQRDVRQADVRDNAQVGQIFQGDIAGHVFIYGQRGKSAEQLLAGYLQRLAGRCGSLPLQGIREQRSVDDTLAISLDQVYTQLATTQLAEREGLAGEQLTQLDVQAYRADHLRENLLPLQQRCSMKPQRRMGDAAQEPRYVDLSQERMLGEPTAGHPSAGLDLTRMSEKDMQGWIGQAERVVFSGPEIITETIATSQHLVLLGEPGSGKSTALRYLALTLARAGCDATFDPAAQLEGWDRLGEQGKLLPLFLPLLPFAKHLATVDHPANAADLWNYIAAHLEAGRCYEGLAAAVHDELDGGRVLLLLDGLDEVAGEDSRRQVVRAVSAFAHAYPTCRIVVSCRVRAYEGEQNKAWQLAGWPTVTLADWTLGQMLHFVGAWYGAAAAASGMAELKRDERVAALRRAIERRDDLRRLGVRPLLLTMMALVHLNDGRLPEERVRLYSRCIDLLLGQWELARADGSGYGTLMDYIGLPDADVKALRPLLEAAAFKAHEAGTVDSPGTLGRDTVRVMVAEALRQRGHTDAWTGAERFLDYTDVRSGLLQASSAGDAYVFPHLTFQEYLAGLELVRGVEFVQRVMQRRNDDRWRVPIMLGIGHLVSEGALALPYQLLSELLLAEGRSPEQMQRDVVFAAEIAEDLGWDRLEPGGAMFKQLRRDLARVLGAVVEGTALPAAKRVQAGVVLGNLGDLRPGVMTLPPVMVRIEGGSFVIGSTPEEAEQAGQQWEAYWRAQGNQENAQFYRTWPTRSEVNAQSLTLPRFALARYPVTNAQYALFIADQGYDPTQPWWDEPGRAWLLRDDAATEGLKSYQRRAHKDQPEYWDHERFGITRPNHPVVGICWYEAMAFCHWLNQHTEYNPEGLVYQLPSEAEWEFAARGSERRTYAWGDEEPDGERANFDQLYNGTSAVGCFAAGETPTRIADLTGTVWEWGRGWYQDYPYDPGDGREESDAPADKYFTLRGGGWSNRPFSLRAAYRYGYSPDYHYDNVGFRLARHLPS